MKKLLVLCFAVYCGSAMIAQTTPEAFLDMVPTPPSDVCSMKSPEREAYLNKVSELSDKIEAETERRKKESDAKAEQIENDLKSGAMKQGGMDAQTAEKLQNMSEEERIAWAMANAGSFQPDNSNAMEMIEVQQQIMALNQSFDTKNKEFANRFNQLENDPEAVQMRTEIETQYREWVSMSGEVSDAEAAKMDQLAAQIKSLKQQYCSKFSPQNISIINDYLAYIKNTIPDYYKFEELQERQFQMQVGAQSPMGEKGLTGILAIRGFLDTLRDVYKYNLLDD